MNRNEVLSLTENIINGIIPDMKQYEQLVTHPEDDVFSLLSGADKIRNHFWGKEIHLCVICNGKSGKCSEDCHFCSQSIQSQAEIPVFSLLEKEQLKEPGEFAKTTPVNRYSIVTSGKRLPSREVEKVAEALSELNGNGISTCASLGVLDTDELQVIKKAGVGRYHHNLETSRSYFKNICSTHTFDERMETIKKAQNVGLSVCAGGIFGIGETDEQVLELALELKDLDVDAIPINFLISIKGTPLENFNSLTPYRCLKIIAIFRYVLPDKDIMICGGRENALKGLVSMVFYAGASGVMTGDYLTTKGFSMQKDIEMIEQLGFTIRKGDLKWGN